VLDETRVGDVTIWLVAGILYVLDAAKLLSPRDLLLVEAGWSGYLTPVFRAYPLTLAGRVLVFGPLLQPYRGVFVAPWGQTWTEAARIEANLEVLARLRGSLVVARLLATWAFGLLFIVGPALSLARGPSTAILYVAAAVYPAGLVASVMLWWRRSSFGMTPTRCAGLGLEVLVCPAFLPNLVRKITTLHRLEADAAQILLETGAQALTEDFLLNLEARADELGEAMDPQGQEQLRVYLATVRGVR